MVTSLGIGGGWKFLRLPHRPAITISYARPTTTDLVTADHLRSSRPSSLVGAWSPWISVRRVSRSGSRGFAGRLWVREATIKTHLLHVFGKLGGAGANPLEDKVIQDRFAGAEAAMIDRIRKIVCGEVA